jgi:hypothetical protein
MLDELLLGGEMQETSKKNVLKAITTQDMLQEVRWGCSSVPNPFSLIPVFFFLFRQESDSSKSSALEDLLG